MQFAFRIASCATRRFPCRPQINSVFPSASALSRSKRPCARLSSTASGFNSTAKHEVKEDADTHQKSQFSSIRPLPTPPPRTKGTPPTISTHDIEEYVQPLYSRGWGLSPILPNGNGLAVLRKRFELGSAEALEEFLADLGEYEEENQVRFRVPFSPHSLHSPVPTRTPFSLSFFSTRPVVPDIQFESIFSTMQRRMCLGTNMPSLSARGRTSPEEGRTRA